MLNPLCDIPTFISTAEHAQLTASTPSSFSDIPPVLRLLDENVEVELDPVFEGLSGRVQGRIWVTEAEVAFLPAAGSSQSTGFSLPYPSLTLHAISPRTESSPAYLYCQIDETPAAGTGLANGDAEQDEPEFTPMRELRVYVSEESKLEPLFLALSHCASLHPSLEPNGEPTSFFGGAFSSGDEDSEPEADPAEDGEAGRAAFAYLESIVDWGNVPKPAGWGENSVDATQDAEE